MCTYAFAVYKTFITEWTAYWLIHLCVSPDELLKTFFWTKPLPPVSKMCGLTSSCVVWPGVFFSTTSLLNPYHTFRRHVASPLCALPGVLLSKISVQNTYCMFCTHMSCQLCVMLHSSSFFWIFFNLSMATFFLLQTGIPVFVSI